MKNKTAFSYLELLFGMVIVVTIFLSAIPFLTKRTNTASQSVGTYVCFAACANNNCADGFHLYESISRNNGAFAAPVDVTASGCTFYKQKNVQSYNIEVIGGGGAGSVPADSTIPQANSGGNGQRIQVASTLSGAFDANGVLTINRCEKTGAFPFQVPYQEELRHCVGGGGQIVEPSGAIRGFGGQSSRNLTDYENLLSFYHDIAFESRTNIGDLFYAGRGDGVFTRDDLTAVEGLAYWDEVNVPIFAGAAQYLNNPGDDNRPMLRESALFLSQRLNGYAFDEDWNFNKAADGEYSRFVVLDNSTFDCPNGNCVARGGAGGESRRGVAPAPADRANFLAANLAACQAVDNPVFNEFDLNNANTFNMFGAGGRHGRMVNINDNTCRSAVGNGGAIIIRWPGGEV